MPQKEKLIRKNRKNVEIAIIGYNDKTLEVETILYTIPVGYRPSTVIYRRPCYIRNTGNGETQFSLCSIGTDGIIKLEPSVTPVAGMNEFGLQATWILN